MSGELLVIGLSHRTAPLELRERLAFGDDVLEQAVRDLHALSSVGEALLLSTCNRVEVYAAAEDGAREQILAFLCASRGVAGASLDAHLYERNGPAAVKHMFRVAASLDSLVVGEPQILGQLKSAYAAALRAGCVGPLLGRCLERSFSVAKRVRSETSISRGAANVSSVAVELAKKVFGDLEGKTVLVLGAGKMSDLAARHLKADGAGAVLVANRTFAKAVDLAARVGGEARSWDDLDQLLTIADVVVSSTAASAPVLTHAGLKIAMKARRRRPIFIIDIAVPRDVEPRAGELEGVYLFDIDDLERVAADNRKGREGETLGAERIVEAETAQFLAWQRAQASVPTIKELHARFHRVAEAEVTRALAGANALGEDAVRALAEAIVQKLLHQPLTALKTDDPELVPAARRLFALGDPTATPRSKK